MSLNQEGKAQVDQVATESLDVLGRVAAKAREKMHNGAKK